MTRLAYYPGCTLKTTAKNFEKSTLATAKLLNMRLVEPERWNCCGTVHALAKDDVMHHLAPIRNMIRVEELKEQDAVDNKKMVTLCAMCYNTLKRTNQVFNSDKDKKIASIKDRLGEALVKNQLINRDQLLKALKRRAHDKIPLGSILIEMGFISTDDLLKFLSSVFQRGTQ